MTAHCRQRQQEVQHAETAIAAVGHNLRVLAKRVAGVESRVNDVKAAQARQQHQTQQLQQQQSPQHAAATASGGDGAGSRGASGLTGRGASGYYHFASDGTRLRSKWDEFDVDAELQRLDSEALTGAARSGSNRVSRSSGMSDAARVASELRITCASMLDALEGTLGDLDDVRGSEKHKAARRALVADTHALMKRVDAVLQEIGGGGSGGDGGAAAVAPNR
jgi:hypothetical protein